MKPCIDPVMDSRLFGANTPQMIKATAMTNEIVNTGVSFFTLSTAFLYLKKEKCRHNKTQHLPFYRITTIGQYLSCHNKVIADTRPKNTPQNREHG